MKSQEDQLTHHNLHILNFSTKKQQNRDKNLPDKIIQGTNCQNIEFVHIIFINKYDDEKKIEKNAICSHFFKKKKNYKEKVINKHDDENKLK